MDELFRSTDAHTPCIFVLSQGADPTGVLMRFAQSRGREAELRVLSLGQGQGPLAESLVEKAAAAGQWVLLQVRSVSRQRACATRGARPERATRRSGPRAMLAASPSPRHAHPSRRHRHDAPTRPPPQNCHLARSWMPALEQLVLRLADDSPGVVGEQSGPHADFRLFLTSFPADYFPVPVLQTSVKVCALRVCMRERERAIQGRSRSASVGRAATVASRPASRPYREPPPSSPR